MMQWDDDHNTKHRIWENSLGGQWVLVEDIPDDPVKCACGWVWTEEEIKEAEANEYPADFDPEEAMRNAYYAGGYNSTVGTPADKEV